MAERMGPAAEALAAFEEEELCGRESVGEGVGGAESREPAAEDCNLHGKRHRGVYGCVWQRRLREG